MDKCRSIGATEDGGLELTSVMKAKDGEEGGRMGWSHKVVTWAGQMGWQIMLAVPTHLPSHMFPPPKGHVSSPSA